MKVVLYWPECTLQHNDSEDGTTRVMWDAPIRTVFWVEATIQEAERAIRPRMTAGVREYERTLSLHPDVRSDHMQDGERLCFLVSQNFDLVTWCFRVYPYSAMWGPDGTPFKPIGKWREDEGLSPDGVHVSSLDALRSFILPCV